MFHWDIVEWALLIALSIGLLFCGWGVNKIGAMTDRGDKPVKKTLDELSNFDKLVLYISVVGGSLIFALGFTILLMYGHDKYY